MRRSPSLRSLLALAALWAAPALLVGARSVSAEPPAPAPAPAPPTGEKPAAEPKPLAKPDEKTRQQVLAALEEIRAQVAKVRGLEWKTKVPADLLSRDQLAANIERMAKEDQDPAEYAKDLKLARRLGMLGPDEDPLEIMKAFFGVGVQGYYDPDKKELFLIDGLSVEGQKPIIFHELVHALDDQHVDLNGRQEAVKKDSDRLFALKCVLEGCAEHARELYEAANPDVAKKSSADTMEQAAEQIAVIKKLPAFLVVPTLLHYSVGPAFVGRAVGKDYVGGMAKLYGDVPVSSEQVLHPEKFLTEHRDLPHTVTFTAGLAASGGDKCVVLDDDVWGEVDFSYWLDFHLGKTGGKVDLQGMGEGRMLVPQARRAAAGWDGARVAFLERPDAPLTVVGASVWDTAADAKEAAEAMVTALQRQYKAKGSFAFAPAADAAGVLRAEWDGPNGLGRAEVEGTKVYLLDGLPKETLPAVFAELRKTKFERAEKDTWDPAKVADPLKDAVWKDDVRGVGWSSGGDASWTVEKDEKDAAAVRLRKGDGPKARVSVNKSGLQSALILHLTRVRSRLPDGFDIMKAVSDEKVAGKTAGKFVWTETAAGKATRHATLFVALEEGTLLVDAEGADANATDRFVDEIAKGFVFRE